MFGDVKRSGGWMVPERSKWGTVFGDVVLDLRQAHVTAGEVTIDAGTIFGDVDLLVPEGVVVEVRSRTFIGDIRQEAGDAGPPDAPRIILFGGSLVGDVKVRARRLREKLAERVLGTCARWAGRRSRGAQTVVARRELRDRGRFIAPDRPSRGRDGTHS